ncbi:hypothetical protein CLV63_11877 [Murinocardiopsis flavida]|uniref:Uncharacterized protein n=1 Tax=Murinocardiopsis flavida TaxID=645275 RepID=A0A2P8D531_9ACTN|nr:hypothetical protein [Murinocardiopsis flavida]PSK92318.1 hypothetical protein CLV63_11877 [Murinocardiopsis flavida]
MEYRIIADLMPPEDTGDLDGLQQYGVSALVSEWLDRAATIKGPDGVEITPFGHDLYVHGAGVVIELLVEAPALAFAENGAEALLREIMERTELLDDWLLGKCEVTVTDAELAEAVEAFADDAPGQGPPSEHPEADVEGCRTRLAAESARLRAFDATAFDPAAPHGQAPQGDAAIAAGALLESAVVLTDELFVDALTLEQEAQSVEDDGEEPTAADCEVLLALHDLPRHWHDRFDALFAKRFLMASAAVFARLTETEWTPPTCTAEALALHLLVEHAKNALADQAGFADDAAESVFAVFDTAAYTDFDHRWIFWSPDTAGVSAEPPAVETWFTRRDPGGHPYLHDLPEAG